MSGVYQFVISLEDRASAVSEKIKSGISDLHAVVGKASDNAVAMQGKITAAFSKIWNGVKTATKGSDTLKFSINELEDKLKELQTVKFGTVLKSEFAKVNREIEQTEKQIGRLKQGISGNGFGSKMKGWRKDFANSLPGSDLIKNPIALAGAAVGGLWTATQKAMEAGKEKVKMQTLTGSAEIGSQLYNGLTKFATDTVFGNELYDMGAQMLANGIKSTDVMPVMKQLGDISMGDSEKLGQLSLAFAQINAKGHLAGQELNQLVNAGFNPLQVISDKTGESVDSLTNKMSKGELSITDVRKAMEMATGKGGKFHNMLNKVADTPYGQLENLKGTLDQIMVKIGEVFLPIASKLMTFLSWIGEKAGPFLQPFIAVLGGLAIGILAVTAAQWAWNIAASLNPVGIIIIGIIALIAVIAYCISKIDGWGEAWKIVVNNAKLTWQVFTSNSKLLWNGVIDGFMIGLNKIKEGWYKFKNAVGIGNETENNAALQNIASDTKNRLDEIIKNKKAVDDASLALKKGGKNAFEALSWNKESSLSGTVNNLKDKLGLTTGGVLGKGDGKGKKEKTPKAAKAKSDGIVSGGSKQTNITININKLQDQTVIHVANTEKGISGLGEKIQEELLRAVNSVNQMQIA